jgi:hypothetical protein
METDLAYYKRRSAEETAAARAAPHSAVRAAHRELARLYDDKVASLEARSCSAPLSLVSAA